MGVAGGGSLATSLHPVMPAVVLLVTIGLMWFLLVRPQRQRVRHHRALIDALEVGDHITTAGGIHGTVIGLDGDDAVVRIARNVEITMLRAAIAHRAANTAVIADEIVLES